MAHPIAGVFGNLGITPSEPKIVKVRNVSGATRVAGQIDYFRLDGAGVLVVGAADSVLTRVTDYLATEDTVSYMPACIFAEQVDNQQFGDAYLWGYNITVRVQASHDIAQGDPLGVENVSATSRDLSGPLDTQFVGNSLRKCYGIALEDVTGSGSPKFIRAWFDGWRGFGLFRAQ